MVVERSSWRKSGICKPPPSFGIGWFLLANILEKIGAGEGIRTLDPNLGKVVLYP
jgi:hypothetical protein